MPFSWTRPVFFSSFFHLLPIHSHPLVRWILAHQWGKLSLQEHLNDLHQQADGGDEAEMKELESRKVAACLAMPFAIPYLFWRAHIWAPNKQDSFLCYVCAPLHLRWDFPEVETAKFKAADVDKDQVLSAHEVASLFYPEAWHMFHRVRYLQSISSAICHYES